MPVTSDGYVVRVSRRNRQTPYETGIVSVTAFRSPKRMSIGHRSHDRVER